MKKEKNAIVDMGEEKKYKFSVFVEKLALVWFVLVVLFFIFKPKIVDFFVTILGQFFSLMGLVLFTQSEGKERKIAIPFFIFGVLGIVVPLLYVHPEFLEQLINMKTDVYSLVCFLFIILGLILIIVSKICKRDIKRKYSAVVTATICEYLHEKDEDLDVYCPVYCFEYKDKIYKINDAFYSNFTLDAVGSKIELRINPDNPKEFYDNRTITYDLFAFIGKIILIIGILLLINLYFPLTS